MNERIGLTDTGTDAIIKMCGGNPGALWVLMEIIKGAGQIDPDGLMGGMGVILSLDTHKIYEERIWMFYKDVCGGNLTDMLGVLRAVQLGFLAEATLNKAINGHYGIDVEALMVQVRERLPRFKKAEKVQAETESSE